MSTWRLSPDTLHQDLGNEIVLLNLKSSEYFSLSGTGKRIWQLAEEHAGDREAIAAAMLREFRVDPDKVRADIDKLHADLVAAGILEAA